MFLNIFTKPLFYIPLIIFAVIVFIVILVIIFRRTPVNISGWEQNITSQLNKHNLNYQLSKSENKNYDYDLVIEDKKYLIKLLGIPSYSEVQVNNIVTWEIKYGAGKNPGKVQPFKKYAQGIEGFMNMKTNTNELKVCILCPEAKKITKYINECEIVFVNHKTNVYGIRLINETDYSLFIK